jgi:pimeloyl-ACP methyl ester carboxylesterase
MRFVLIHGGMHGGWCWEKLTPEINLLGHSAIAPDLPGSGDRLDEEATLDGWKDTVIDLIEPNDILVGHSLGGASITLAADARPDEIQHLIYLAAPIPLPEEGKTIADSLPQYATLPGVEYGEREFWCADFDAAKYLFYLDCTETDQRWAFDRIRPQALAPITSVLKLKNFWSSSIPRSYIACLADNTSASIIVQENLQRLGLRVAYPMWASHSPFLSRPNDLARLLVDIVENPIASAPDQNLIETIQNHPQQM